MNYTVLGLIVIVWTYVTLMTIYSDVNFWTAIIGVPCAYFLTKIYLLGEIKRR